MPSRYDPFAPEVRDDPYPHYARLRALAPVHRLPGTHCYTVARFDDVCFVLRSPELFSSDAMRTVFLGGRPGADPAGDPAAAGQMAALLSQLPFSPEELVTARHLIAADPPVHEELRSLVSHAFTPRRLASWEGRIRSLVEQSLARLQGSQGFDVVGDLAGPLPVTVISEMLGVEADRREEFKRWAGVLLSCTSGSGLGRPGGPEAFARTLGDFSRTLLEIVERRRRAPRDDLVTDLLRAEGARPLAPVEIAMFALLILTTGSESTTHLIANAVNALFDHPDQLARVCADPELVPGLVEETLRFDPPAQLVFRRAVRDVELGDALVPRDATVLALIASANRDEARWPRPDRFDVARDARGHLAFGHGIHACLGASLSRLEARVALEGLIGALPGLRRVEAPREAVDSFVVRGPRRILLTREGVQASAGLARPRTGETAR